jgi:hypothetical protein
MGLDVNRKMRLVTRKESGGRGVGTIGIRIDVLRNMCDYYMNFVIRCNSYEQRNQGVTVTYSFAEMYSNKY